MSDITMPSLGSDMQKGVLVQWHIKPGDTVKRGDIIAQIEAEKGVFEMESFEDGIVERLIAEPGTTIPVGGTMAVLRDTDKK
jgi:pyruvate dehydrogenase E2 component (dihydrolipoamide acetyltransferase)